METVSDFIFLGSKITADGDCSHEIKRRLFLGRKVMTHLDSIFKSRDITLPKKFHLVKAMVFPVVMYRCESWTVKKAESLPVQTRAKQKSPLPKVSLIEHQALKIFQEKGSVVKRAREKPHLFSPLQDSKVHPKQTEKS